MKKRVCLALVAVLLVLSAAVPALAQEEIKARFPGQRGVVTDDTNALSEAMMNDIAEFQTLSASRTGVKTYVAMVHFLDGVDAQTYANKLFERWGLGSGDVLLLGAAGEDTFATASGAEVKKHFSDSNAQSMLYTSGFSELFKGQQYDAAFGRYFVAFADMLNKQYSANITLGRLFASYQTEAKTAAAIDADSVKDTVNGVVNGAVSFGSELWGQVMSSINSNVREYDDYHERREQERGGLTPAGWIVLIILIMIVFGQSNPARKARKVAGCGCSPLGWIFGLFGLGSFLGKKRR